MASKPCLIVIALLGSALNCALVEGFKSAGKGSLLSENKFQHGNEMKGAEMKEISSNEEPRAERVGKKLPADRERKRKWLQDELERLRSVISKKSKKADSERVVLTEKDGETKSSSLESILADRVVGDEKKSSKESATEKTDSPGGGIAKAIKDAKDKIFSKKSDESEGSGNPPAFDEKPRALFPWRGAQCEDRLECSDFDDQQFCKVFPHRAYESCRKTCKLCAEDHPKGRKLYAFLKPLNGEVSLYQSGPGSSVFMTACFDKDLKILKAGALYGITIHERAKIGEQGTKCLEIGPDFNPYSTGHGNPYESTMKHVGDLGNLDFMAPASEEWPKNIPKCNKSTLAAYGLFNHIDLFGIHSPVHRPVVIHDEPDNFSPATKNSAGNPLACGKLQNREGLEDNIEGSENQEDASEGSGEEKKSLGPLALLSKKIKKFTGFGSDSEEGSGSKEATKDYGKGSRH